MYLLKKLQPINLVFACYIFCLLTTHYSSCIFSDPLFSKVKYFPNFLRYINWFPLLQRRSILSSMGNWSGQGVMSRLKLKSAHTLEIQCCRLSRPDHDSCPDRLKIYWLTDQIWAGGRCVTFVNKINLFNNNPLL